MAGLSERRRRAIEALLTARTVTAAAAQCGVGERTLRRWLADEAFRAAYREVGRQRLSDTVNRLRAAADEAVEALRTALADDRTSNRIRAATVLLETAVKLEVDDLAVRVQALEALQRYAQRAG